MDGGGWAECDDLRAEVATVSKQLAEFVEFVIWLSDYGGADLLIQQRTLSLCQSVTKIAGVS